MALYHTFMVAISFLCLLITPSLVCFTTASKKKQSLGFSLKLIHRDSPESPLHPGNLTLNERMSRYAKWSVVRASHLSSITVTKSNATTSAVDNSNILLRPSVYVDGIYHYMVTVGIGTPFQDSLLLLDTAGHLTWTQCLPCEGSCFGQQTPLYDSRNSTTYQTTDCASPLCDDMSFECDNRLCTYDIVYGSGQRTAGFAMNETLSFPTADGAKISINDIVLGCSKNSENFPYGDTDGNIGGVMGLSSAPYSLVNQLNSFIDGNFSYCLTPDESTSAYLRFGEDIIVRGTGPVQRTPFVYNLGPYYGLILHDISIENIPLNYTAGTFAPKIGGGGGCLIDSGAPFTLIERAAFNTFIAAFENFFAQTSPLLRNTMDCHEPDLYCYYRQGVMAYPSVTFHFQDGANYTVPPENLIVHQELDGREWFLLAIMPAGGTILGAWQQYNMRIVYDLADGYLSFVPEDCTYDAYPPIGGTH